MVKVGRFEFEGPFENPDRLKPQPGVYAIIAPGEGEPQLIDVGQAGDIRTRIREHEHKPIWEDLSGGRPVLFAVNYTHRIVAEGRKVIEDEIRTQFEIPCSSTS